MPLLDALAWRLSSRQDAWRSSHQRRLLSLFITIDAPPGQRQVTLPAAVLQEAAKAPPGRPVGTSLTQVPAAVARTMEAVRPALRNMALLTPECSEAILPKHWAWAQPDRKTPGMASPSAPPIPNQTSLLPSPAQDPPPPEPAATRQRTRPRQSPRSRATPPTPKPDGTLRPKPEPASDGSRTNDAGSSGPASSAQTCPAGRASLLGTAGYQPWLQGAKQDRAPCFRPRPSMWHGRGPPTPHPWSNPQGFAQETLAPCPTTTTC